jgi:hypothetical protein
MGCDEIAAEKARIEEALVPLYNRQRQIRRNDLATSLLTAGVVAGNSLISDNQAPQEIAKLKGEGVALNDAIALQGCRIPAVKMPAPPKPKAPDKCVNGNPYCYG